MKLTGAQIIVEVLIEQGCDCVFGYPGGQIINTYDALYERRDRIKHVLSAHEQGAAHAADGYARATGKTGVVIATSGPGATNLVTGIATAYLDSVPMVAITGNVPCNLLGRDSFQEVDICGVTMPVTKHNYIVKDVNELADTIREAFRLAKSGRPGPVLVDVPKDVQIAKCDFENIVVAPPFEFPKASADDISKAAEMISQSERPYIYCGGGVIAGGAGREVMDFAELIDSPIGCSMMGISAVPESNPRFLGMQGMHGHYASSMAQSKADLVIAIGARFSDRATGKMSVYVRNCKILHIDVDNAEIDKNVESQLGINGDVKETLKKLIAAVPKQQHDEWSREISALREKEKEMLEACLKTPEGKDCSSCTVNCKNTGVPAEERLNPYKIIDTISKFTNKNTVVATDVGQHQMWVAQRYPFEKERTFISSGGLGTMGFGMGAAIGASEATGERTVLFTGDGSFGMNLNELATAVSQNTPLVIVIMNNGVLGMVRQWQTLFFQKHYSNTTLNRKTDFVKLAEAFGAKGSHVSTEAELEAAAKEAFEENGPYVIDCLVDCNEFVLPMLPPGGSIDDIITEIHGGEI
ncbi:MAG: thiamine pyrophosphate-binding protein [Porcipelethomonas sp.]